MTRSEFQTRFPKVLAIDPGTTESAALLWDGTVLSSAFLPNAKIRGFINLSGAELVAIEMIASYGMPVGREVFETCVWIGRFVEWAEAAQIPWRMVYRKDIKLSLCGTARAKDGNIRQALIDKHGAPGTKKAPGPTYGVSGHLWAALAVADYAANPSNL